MKTFLESEEADIQVELIPLLDVVFCLLAVFILGTVGLSRPEGINLDLPTASTSVPQVNTTLRVQVGILGETLVNGQRVNKTQLQQLVSRYIRLKPNGVVVLKADGSASYSEVVSVLDLLRSVGGERVALETVKDKSPVSPPGQSPNPSPGEPTPLPVPSIEDPSGTIPGQPAIPGQPSVPGQPSIPGQPAIPGQSQNPATSPLTPLPGSNPLQPSNPNTP